MSDNSKQVTFGDSTDSTDSRIDTGASEQFKDDRKTTQKDPDSGEQYELVAEENPGKGFTTTKGQGGLDDFSDDRESDDSEQLEADLGEYFTPTGDKTLLHPGDREEILAYVEDVDSEFYQVVYGNQDRPNVRPVVDIEEHTDSEEWAGETDISLVTAGRDHTGRGIDSQKIHTQAGRVHSITPIQLKED